MRLRRGISVRTLIPLAGIAVLAVGVGVAAGDLNVNSASVEIDTKEAGSVDANCARPVSGGFDGPGFDRNGGPEVLTVGSRRDGRRAWEADGVNFGASGTLVSHVYCSRSFPRLEARSAGRTVAAGEAESVRARCPRGSEAVSGGFAIEDNESGDMYVYISRRLRERRWIARGHNFGPQARKLRTFVYCAKRDLGLEARSAADTTTEHASTVFAEAQCRRGTRVVSGGFAGQFVVGGKQSTPFQSMRTGSRRWGSAGSAGFVGGTGPTLTWTTYAYCVGAAALR